MIAVAESEVLATGEERKWWLGVAMWYHKNLRMVGLTAIRDGQSSELEHGTMKM